MFSDWLDEIKMYIDDVQIWKCAGNKKNMSKRKLRDNNVKELQ